MGVTPTRPPTGEPVTARSATPYTTPVDVNKMVASDRAAFLDWFPKLADIGRRCRDPIDDAIRRGGFMATGQAKVIDNAIMGFMQGAAKLNGGDRASG